MNDKLTSWKDETYEQWLERYHHMHGDSPELRAFLDKREQERYFRRIFGGVLMVVIGVVLLALTVSLTMDEKRELNRFGSPNPELSHRYSRVNNEQ